jgi:hypothetical protein
MTLENYLLGAVVFTLYATAESCGFRTFKYRATWDVNGPTQSQSRQRMRWKRGTAGKDGLRVLRLNSSCSEGSISTDIEKADERSG